MTATATLVHSGNTAWPLNQDEQAEWMAVRALFPSEWDMSCGWFQEGGYGVLVVASRESLLYAAFVVQDFAMLRKSVDRWSHRLASSFDAARKEQITA